MENQPLCSAHEAMQNTHNLLILAQAGKIKLSECLQVTEEILRVCKSQQWTHTHAFAHCVLGLLPPLS